MFTDGGCVEVATDPKKRGAGKTVLVVDDSEVLRKTIEKAFLSDGFATCVEATNGEEAIEVAKRCQPDLIVLDLSMPVMNGLQAAPILRTMFPKIPIFLFSFYADVMDEHLAAMAGISIVISKDEPISKVVHKAHEMMGK
jgi:CheY-like chemotaxis protein